MAETPLPPVLLIYMLAAAAGSRCALALSVLLRLSVLSALQ